MYCQFCGKEIADGARYCQGCGTAVDGKIEAAPVAGGLRGFSPRINDPAFAEYLRKNNRVAAIFSIGLGVVAIVGFYIAGEVGTKIRNPEAFYQGLVVGALFLALGFFQIMGRARSQTWDGTVENKTIKKKTRTERDQDGSVTERDSLLYTVIIRRDGGRRYKIKRADNDFLYNYFEIGDRVRHHGGLKTYEKYDKTGDRQILCNACSNVCDMDADYCSFCKCPLLK